MVNKMRAQIYQRILCANVIQLRYYPHRQEIRFIEFMLVFHQTGHPRLSTSLIFLLPSLALAAKWRGKELLFLSTWMSKIKQCIMPVSIYFLPPMPMRKRFRTWAGIEPRSSCLQATTLTTRPCHLGQMYLFSWIRNGTVRNNSLMKYANF